MTEEQFFRVFLEKMRSAFEKLSPINLKSSALREAYLAKWFKNVEAFEPDYPVVSCDGSMGKSSFSGGLVVLVARAVAHTYLRNKMVDNHFSVEVKADYKLEETSLFMKTLELRVLREALEKAVSNYGRALGILDGSLYLTFLHNMERLKKTLWIFKGYVKELSSLLEFSGRGVMLIGVSKNSDVNYLRMKIMTEVISRLDLSLSSGIRRGRGLLKTLRENVRKEGRGKFEGSALKTLPR
ncbi:MAG: DNA double-strand break repair nuclease NurA [Thermoproteota archaeon]